MCGGNDNPPPVFIHQAPPPVQEILDTIDEVTGTKTITIVDPATGKKSRVTKRLPKTPEEEAFSKQMEGMIGNTIQNISRLADLGDQSIMDYTPLINTFAQLNEEQANDLKEVANIGNIDEYVSNFRNLQKDLMNREFHKEDRALENELVRRGRNKSTYGAEQKAAMLSNRSLTRQQAELKSTQYGEDLAGQRLQRNAQAFELNERGRSNRLNQAKTGYDLERQRLSDLEDLRQRNIQDNKTVLGIAQGMQSNDLSKALSGNTYANSLGEFAQRNNANLQNYESGVRTNQMNYMNQLNAYENRPMGVGEGFAQLGSSLVGRGIGKMLGGSFGGDEGGRIGSQIGSRRRNY
jgi:hypothetical protein